MEFEELKVVWDAQNASTLYAYDQGALERRIAKRLERLKSHTDFVELMLALIMATTGLLTLSEPLLFGEDKHQFATGSIFVLLAVFLVFRRRLRQRMHLNFSNSITGMLDEAISQLEHHIGHVRSMALWLGIPYVAVLFIGYAVVQEGKPLWVWLVSLGALPLGLWVNHRGIQRSLIPRKREFESLREKLKDVDAVSGSSL